MNDSEMNNLSMYDEAFYNEQKNESLRSAKAIVPILMETFRPKSVIDVGCGVGGWLSVFQQHGVEDFHGYDANDLSVEQYFIDKRYICAHQDLASPAFQIGRQADLLISLEVAEHLPSSAGDAFVEKLTGAAPVVVFSAALPGQTGVNHVNEQPPWYWREKFNKAGYVEVDFIRPLVLRDERVCWWYRQNMTCFIQARRLSEDHRLSALAAVHGQIQGEHKLTVINEWVLNNLLGARGASSREDDPGLVAPCLSIIIPTCNRAGLLYNALDSISRQTYPADRFEVIVANNGSMDETEEVCRHFSRRMTRLKHVYEPRPGLHNARQAGLKEARGEILIYAEDDLEALPNWLEGLAESYRDPAVAGGGKILPKYEEVFTHLTREEKYRLMKLAMSTPGSTFVEIGSYKGASACFIAAGIEQRGTAATLYCVDTWENEGMSEGKQDTFAEFLDNTRDFEGLIVPLRGRSEEVAKEFHGSIDFLFIDGGHGYDDVRKDFLSWFPKLKPGALVAFHDVGWAEGVQQVVKRFVEPLASNKNSLPNLYWANVHRLFLSVVIPTRNRAKLLYQTLESLIGQTYPADCFEVIVVDNGSTDATAQVCQHFQHRIPGLRYLYDARVGLHNGRHSGLNEARGEILVYADDDIEALPTWLEGVAESFRDPAVALAGGKILPKFESTPPEWISALSCKADAGWALTWYSLLDFGDSVHEIPHEYVWGCNFSIRKEVLQRAGGFHPDAFPQELIRYRGDGETAVSQAVRQMGLKCLYNPKASVYHVISSGRMTLEYIYQRAFNQGISDSFTGIRRTRSLSAARSCDRCGNEAHDTVNRGLVEGFNYHQELCAQDIALQQWVLQDEYISKGG